MTTPTLDEKLTQFQLMGTPAFLAAWSARHPEQQAVVRDAIEALVDHELARRHERAIAARIQAAKFVQVQTVDTFDFEYNVATRQLRRRYLNICVTDLVAEGIGPSSSASRAWGRRISPGRWDTRSASRAIECSSPH